MYNNIDSRETKPKISILNIPVILKGADSAASPSKYLLESVLCRLSRISHYIQNRIIFYAYERIERV